MKRKKKIWSLVGLVIFLVVLFAIYVSLKGNDEPEDAKENEAEENTDYLLEWYEKKTRKMSLFTEDGEKLVFSKAEDGWKLENYEKISLIQEKLKSIIEYVSAIEVERTIEHVEDLSEYGLDKPRNVIERETENGMVESFAIGLYNNAMECTYIYLNDETDVVYAIGRNLGNLYKCKIVDFVESEAYPSFISDNMKMAEVIKSNGSFVLQADFNTTTGWFVEDAQYGKKLADEYEGDNLASMLSVLSYSEFYEYDCQDFSVYGLDKPQMEIRVTYHENVKSEKEETEMQTVERSFTIYVGDYDEAGYYYVRKDDSKEVHGIAETPIKKLLDETAVDYWALNMGEISLDKLDYMNVEFEGKHYALKKVVTEVPKESSGGEVIEDEVEKVITYYLNDEKVNSDIFENFYRHAVGIECQERKEFLEIEQDAELVMDFYGVDGTRVLVSYIPWDENFYAVVYNGTDFGLVNKRNVKNLKELFLNVIE